MNLLGRKNSQPVETFLLYFRRKLEMRSLFISAHVYVDWSEFFSFFESRGAIVVRYFVCRISWRKTYWFVFVSWIAHYVFCSMKEIRWRRENCVAQETCTSRKNFSTRPSRHLALATRALFSRSPLFLFCMAWQWPWQWQSMHDITLAAIATQC